MMSRPSLIAWSLFLPLVWLDYLEGRLYTGTKQYKRGAGTWKKEP